jgi:hypothetical protein
MNNTYKGLKYLTFWILIYFVVKYTCNDKLNNIDMILMTTLLTLILCIIDNIFCLSNLQNELFTTQYEYMTNIHEQPNTTTTVSQPTTTTVSQPTTTTVSQPTTTTVSQPSTTTVSQPSTTTVSQPTATAVSQPTNLFATGETKNGFVIDTSQTNDEKWHEQKLEPRKYSGAENINQIGIGNGQTRNNLLVNHMQYSDFNRMPPSFYKNDFEYGYSFMPPRDWYPVPPYPPVCSSNETCITQPVYIDNSTMNLKEWNQTQKITPPDSINTKYIAEITNSNN